MSSRREGICTKLQPAYRGSFLVYTLADENGKSWVVNHDKLELYLGDLGIILNLLSANQRYSICGVVLL